MDTITIITQVGFPIAATIALAMFCKSMIEEYKKANKELLLANKELIDTNRELVNTIRYELAEVKTHLEDIASLK